MTSTDHRSGAALQVQGDVVVVLEETLMEADTREFALAVRERYLSG